MNASAQTTHLTGTPRVRSRALPMALGLVAWLLVLAALPTLARPVLTVAVLDFESRDDAVREFGTQVSGLLNAHLSADPAIITVERAELAKVLSEQELGLSGNVSSETAARVGHLTGAKVLVTGRVFRAGNDLVLVAKIIGTETSRVYGELVKGQANASVVPLAEELARKISGTVGGERSETLVAQVETRADRVAKIKKSLKPGPLPTVSVRISEQHYGQPVNDPAAETELTLILKECGFTVVTDSSTTPPDLRITGEAFSALGLRKGNLTSCKARVEIKALRSNDEVAAAERQTSVAVDIAEQTAAKTALQEAAAELAERLVPRLTP